MNRIQFVGAIRDVVQDAASTDTIALLKQPPGGRPDPDLLALSSWFHSLSAQERENLERVAQMSARLATFGFLCVLDGVRAIEDGPGRGTLDLRYRRKDLDMSLNDDVGSVLHEML